MADTDIVVAIDADTTGFDRALGDLERTSQRFGSVLTGALKSAVVSGRSLEDVLRQVATRLTSMALDAGLKPLQRLAGSLFEGLLGGILPFAKGGVVPMAAGGVVSQPTFFPAGGRLGVMGEAGAEAIMPLARGADGRLGVRTAGGGGGVNVTFNVTATDAASFQKSEGQITAMLARAAMRGSRGI